MSLSLITVLAQALSLTAGDYSEARFRSDGSGQYVDLVTTPRVALSLDFRRTSWTLYYAPTLTDLGVGSTYSTTLLIHAGGLGVQLKVTPRTSLTWSELATYGTQNFRAQSVGALGANGTPVGAIGGQPNSTASTTSGQSNGNASTVLAVPGNTDIKYGGLMSTLAMDHLIHPDWTLNSYVGYIIQGQLNSTVPVVIPRMQTYFGSVGLAHSFSKRNRLTLSESARYALLEPNSASYIATTNVSWNHVYNPNVVSNAFVSESYVNSIDILGRHSRTVLAGAGASLMLTDTVRPMSSQLTATITLSVMPFIDPQSGGINEMANGAIGTTWTRRRLSLQFSGFFAQSLTSYGDVAVTTVYGLNEGIGYQLDKRHHWQLTAGVREAFQKFPIGPQMPVMWGAFVGLAYTTGAINL